MHRNVQKVCRSCKYSAVCPSILFCNTKVRKYMYIRQKYSPTDVIKNMLVRLLVATYTFKGRVYLCRFNALRFFFYFYSAFTQTIARDMAAFLCVWLGQLGCRVYLRVLLSKIYKDDQSGDSDPTIFNPKA